MGLRLFGYPIDSILQKSRKHRRSRSNEARNVGRLSAPHWKVINSHLRGNFQDMDYIVPAADAKIKCFSILDKSCALSCTCAFRGAFNDGGSAYNVIHGDDIPRALIDDLRGIARVAGDRANNPNPQGRSPGTPCCGGKG